MKKHHLSVIALFLGAIAGLPYGAGMYAKREFMEQIKQSQALMDSEQTGLSLNVTNYHQGWLKSNADVTITGTIETSSRRRPDIPVNLPIKIVISHGPVFFADNKIEFGLGYLQGYIMLPEGMQALVPDDNGKNIYLEISTVMKMDPKTVLSTYKMPALTFKQGISWEGLTGDSVTDIKDDKISNVKYNLKFGRLTGDVPAMGAAFNVEPITSTMTLIINDDNNKSSTSSLQSGGLNVEMQGKNIAKLKSININSSAEIKNGVLGSKVDAAMNDFYLPAMGVINSIPSFNYMASVTNLNYQSLNQLRDLLDKYSEKMPRGKKRGKKMPSLNDEEIKPMVNELINVFNANSAFDTTMNLDTNLGKSTLLVGLSLSDKPKKLEDFYPMSNIKIEFSISKELVNELQKSIFKYMKPRRSYLNRTVTGMSQSFNMQKADMSSGSGQGDFYQAVANMVKSKTLSADQSIAVMGLPEQKPATVADVDAAVAKMGLTPEVAEKVKAAYVSQYLSSSQTLEQPQPAAPEAQPFDNDRELTPKEMLDEWVKQGVLVDKGDSYTFEFTKAGNDMKLNGSADNPLLIPVKAVLSGNMEAMTSVPAVDAVDEKSGQLVMLIYGVTTAIDALAQKDGAYNNPDVTPKNIALLMPNSSLATPWGATAIISDQTKESYVVTFNNVPSTVCKDVKSRLQMDPKYLVKSNCDSAANVDFIYEYNTTR